jgi:hypothetical protein
MRSTIRDGYSRREFLGAGTAVPFASAGAASTIGFERHLRDDHDEDLPAWGPYTNRYIGISHIADARRGLRFDLGVFPGYYRRKVIIPNGRWESDFHPWEASADLRYYAFRHQLEWKDRVCCDASYSWMDEAARLIRCACVNATARPQNLVINYIGYLVYPRVQYEARLPRGAQWIDAVDYRRLAFATPRPQDNLTYDGWLRGEAVGEEFVGGSGVAQGFGRERGDVLEYEVTLPEEIGEAALTVRYRAARGEAAHVTLPPWHAAPLALEGAGEFRTLTIRCGRLAAGRHRFRFQSEGGAALELDGFALTPAAAAAEVRFEREPQELHPEALEPGARPNSVLLKYKPLPHWYGVAWNHPRAQVRQYLCDELESFFRYRVQDHVSLVQRGAGEGHYTNVFLRPIPIAPRETAVLHGMVCHGSRAEVEQRLRDFPAEAAACERMYHAARGGRVEITGNAAGRPYQFSQQRLAMCGLTNVYFPLYVRRRFIKHTTAGKFWHMLYTWDAGFTALGLLEADLGRAVSLLNLYLTAPGDEHAAFLHHGTPLPVQIYLFHEIWNRTQSRPLLERFYPRLRQYHQFLAGRLGSSTTRRLNSQLLQTWDYFYNTGWDDYPPQMEMHRRKAARAMAPPVTTAHAIRTAKLLDVMAGALGEAGDQAIYREDIAVWAGALQRWAWDEASGYFGYVEHDERGEPRGIFRHASGQNFNMGMCGVYPLFAGICTAAQEQRLVGHLMSPDRLWTPIGMTTVDQSAPYYLPDGYWNGAVWFPHQWFFWKALLDLGYGEEAERVAAAALRVWKEEVDDTYGCFEHFMVDTGRGAGWHHFSSLSAPVLSWYSSYYRPGWLTTGFDAWVERRRVSPDARRIEADLRLTGVSRRGALALCVLADGTRPRATVDGREAPVRLLKSGAAEVRLPPGEGVRRLVVEG